MGLLRIIRDRLVVKLGLLVVFTVMIGFLGSAGLALRRQRRVFEDQSADAAVLLTQALSAGVRSSMLTGNPLATRELLAHAGTGLTQVHARVFDPQGQVVFAPKGPPPAPASLPAPLREVLAGRGAGRAANGATLLPVAHEERCAPCHNPPGILRGVLEFGDAGASRPLRGEGRAEEVLTEAVRAGFVQIMTAKKTAFLDGYFTEVAQRAVGVKTVTVFDPEAAAAFGETEVFGKYPAVTEALVRGVIERNAAQTVQSGETTVQVVPLANERRCHGCHHAEDRMRGALLVAFEHADRAPVASLGAVSESSVRYIMLSGLGRLTTGYLDTVAASGGLGVLRLYDPEGRLYHDALAQPEPPTLVARALAGQTGAQTRFEMNAGREEFHYVQALRNEPACQRCHGDDRPLRGALEIVMDTTSAQREVQQLKSEAGVTFGGTMIAVLLALTLALRVLVIAPVRSLSAVAERIGAGNLDVEAAVGSNDEMGRLAHRVNEMVTGLRERLHLTRFVSRGTVQAVVSTGAKGLARGGQREHVVVLFSDIRGFTSFSESREPEEVVAMLNVYLDRQAEVVHTHGGDIDKFVGDEVMALFSGEGAEKRAVRAAVEMVRAVEALGREKGASGIAIGVGVHAGPAIVGAMGSHDRMDFTAIGDTVNLGARLCSNAARGQTLVTEAVRSAVMGEAGLVFTALEPLQVKGKVKPVPVFSVRDKAEEPAHVAAVSAPAKPHAAAAKKPKSKKRR